MSEEKKASLLTPVGRLSYPHLFKNETYKGKDLGKKSAQLLIPKDFSIKVGKWDAKAQETLYTAIKQEAANAIVAKFGRDKSKWPEGLKTNPFTDGDKKQDLQGHKGCWVLKAKTGFDFTITTGGNEKITDPKDIAAGCYARFLVSIAAWGDKTKGGISIYLNGVQRVGKGVPFEGTAKAGFDSVEDTDMDEDYNPAAMQTDENFDLENDDLVFD